MKIGFLGCGKMATALVQGMLDSGAYESGDIVANDVSREALEALVAATEIRPAANNVEVAQKADAVILCVKPQDAPLVAAEIRGAMAGKLLISIAAGVDIATLAQGVGDEARVVRVMPNSPAQVHMGATAFSCGPGTTTEDAETAEGIFSSVGIVFEVKESLLDAVTGLSGSGPAYTYLMIEAMADGGVAMGLPRDLALKLAAQTVAGAAQMVIQTESHPAALKDFVASPGGTTIAGLERLETSAVRGAFMGAVRAAAERSMELGATSPARKSK